MSAFTAIWFVIMILGFAICGWLCVFRTNMAGDVGTEECENEVRMVPIFKHTDEVWVPHIHSLRRNIPLALGNRHHLRSVFSSFPLACGNHTDTPLCGPLDISSSPHYNTARG